MNEKSRPARRLSEDVSATDSSARAGRNASAPFLPHEDEQLYGIVGQAFDCEAIVGWNNRRLLVRLERKEEELAQLKRLSRETDPARIRSGRKAA
jgi:hypothetical protein